jgi:DNA-directed RNA polymerase specialized sigma subunit
MGLPEDNMVESTGKKPAPTRQTGGIEEMLRDLVKITQGVVSEKDLEFDLKQIEKREGWEEKDDSQKINFTLERAERSIKQWYFDLELEMKKIIIIIIISLFMLVWA